MKDYNEKAAMLAVNFAVNVKPGDLVFIQGSEVANDLIKAVYIETLKAGGHPIVQSGIKGIDVARYKYSNDEQLAYFNPVRELIMTKAQKMISVYADHNRQKMTLINPEKVKLTRSSPKFMEVMKIYQERLAKKEIKWTIVPYPCDSFAQDAKMDTESYKEFIYKALKLDSENPAEAWREIEEKQEKIIEILNKVDKIQVLGEDTDLTLSVKGRPWENCCGHENLPDGEVFTSPIEDSINGRIRFTYPGIYQGKEIKNILLEFKDGRVIKGIADEGQELLDSILTIDNADIIGEFAIGTNYGIQKFTKNMLFDEKMGGTMHMALGMGFPETKSENTLCAIHWDILKDMKSEDSKIIADGKVIYQAGKWLI
ncbi:aminopeptidase [Promethearchaeum syntrophicum]|uniref:Aminopeptidase n=1 Tax=Promethearchaeum syntrophicum TaxID=2594042 RepID=A0A5B9DG45_9ARCH|nr:aminopeptidase [Candidatus Prometheoarchaeum syntrophicum]QEE18094.1 Thermophilic metalloprotease (M29) [Candidatus Prometheoarchaeum syntrophicum]